MVLYGLSLYLAKIVVTTRRGSEQIDIRGTARQHWNVVLGVAVAGGLTPYAFYQYGGVQAANSLLKRVGSSYRAVPAGDALGVAPDIAVGIYGALVAGVFVVAGLAYLVYVQLDPDPDGEFGDPTAIDLSTLDAGGVRAAPPEAFADLTEDEATRYASEAIEADNKDESASHPRSVRRG